MPRETSSSDAPVVTPEEARTVVSLVELLTALEREIDDPRNVGSADLRMGLRVAHGIARRLRFTIPSIASPPVAPRWTPKLEPGDLEWLEGQYAEVRESYHRALHAPSRAVADALSRRLIRIINALALPRFTQADVAFLREMVGEIGHNESEADEWGGKFYDLANRIGAVLPETAGGEG